MSHEERFVPEPIDDELREDAAAWIGVGAALVGAAASVGGLAWTVQRGRRQEAREKAMLDSVIGRQERDSSLVPEAGFGQPPIDLTVEGYDMPISLEVEDDFDAW